MKIPGQISTEIYTIVDAGVLEDDSQIVACETVKAYGKHPGSIRVRLNQLRG